ncbi:DUF2142 domain-containing protein [Cryobacterium algoritolerans]|uniref:DUF2142 domain-containing protein n=1 Tax=Cryobacterium algoritolerans TaxID=1259184 RepID=A0A4V3IFB1_9MICO|nr:DUF2142 domain-containing protein [Cryobacterium algoritolerans]
MATSRSVVISDIGKRSVFAFAFGIVFALAALWALASPIFSVPDESAHATKAIAQVRGQVIGHEVPGIKHLVVDLPEEYRYSPQIVCFAFHPETPANCGVELGDPSGTTWFNTWVGAYNPLYYYAVGWPSLLLDGSAGIYGMRIASALIGSMFIAFAFQIAVAGRRSRWMPLGVAFAAMPMCVYLFGSVNPNGIEVASAVALWVALPRLLESLDDRGPTFSPTPPPWYLWFVVTLASVALTTARALGPLWLVVVVLLCFVVSGWRPVSVLFTRAKSYWWLSVIAAASLFSIFWTLGGGSLSSQAEKSDAPMVGATFIQGFTYVVRATPDFLQQALGIFGWADSPLPSWTYWSAVAASAILLMLAFTAVRRRGVVSLTVVVAASLLIPALVQGYSVSQTGIIWQGRYGLFLYLGVTIVASWLLSRAEAAGIAHMSVRVTWVVASLVGTFGILAFVFVMQRYVIGNTVPVSAMWKNPAWQPPLGWPTLVCLYVLATVAFVAVVGLMAMRTARADHPVVRESPTVPPSPRA